MPLRRTNRLHQEALGVKSRQYGPTHLPDRSTGKISGQRRIIVVAQTFHDHGTDPLVHQSEHRTQPPARLGGRGDQGLS